MIKVAIFMFGIVMCVEAQEGSTCRTPSQLEGICISIKFCNEYLELLSAYGASPYVSDLLRQVHCGWQGNDPMVCCPQIKSKHSTNVSKSTASTSTTVKVDTTTRSLAEKIIIQPSQYSTLPQFPACGINTVGKSRVVNGVPALLGEFPWVVALGYRNSKNPSQPKWLCGGTMITDRHILTAGHCVHNRPDLYLARVGELDLYSDEDGAHPTNVSLLKVKVHEHYNPTSFSNDIAIVTLMQPHNNPTVIPICLPIAEPLRSNDFVGGFPFVAGWGALYFNGPSSSKLQTAVLPVVTNEQCSRAFINFRTTTIDHRVLCAGYLSGGKDACQGDSGGPLMHSRLENKTFTFYQIGIVSYGFRCAEQGYPGVYTRVTAFVDWIEKNLN